MLTTSETDSVSEIDPEVTAGLTETNVWLQGPAETRGAPFGSDPYRVRTARTRHWTVPVHFGSEWKV